MNIVYIAMSLDGYIARLDDSCDFLVGDGSDNDNFGTYQSFYDSIDEIVMGATTYKQIVEVLSPDKWPYDKKCYVLSNYLSKTIDNEKNEIVSNFDDLLSKISNKKIWLCGGSQLIKIFWETQKIDQLVVSIIPIVLGEGKSLFQGFLERRLHLEEVKNYNGIVECYYKIKY